MNARRQSIREPNDVWSSWGAATMLNVLDMTGEIHSLYKLAGNMSTSDTDPQTS